VQRRRPSSRGSAPRRASPETVGSCVISVRLLPPVSLPCSSLCPSTAYATSPSSLSKCAGELDAVKERGGDRGRARRGAARRRIAAAPPRAWGSYAPDLALLRPSCRSPTASPRLLDHVWIKDGSFTHG
jgi:hypothetical protein